MTKNKIISLVLAIAMFITFMPINISIASNENNELTYEKLKEALDIVLAKVSSLDKFERDMAIILLKDYVQISTDDDNNGIDDGIDELIGLLNGDGITEGSFIDQLRQKLVRAIDARGISLEQAANAIKLLNIWDVEDRIELVESLDSEDPIKFFDRTYNPKDTNYFVNEILIEFPNIGELFSLAGISIDEFSFFAFLAQRAIDKPIFEDDGDSIKLIQDNRFDELKSKLDNALNGITISGKTFTENTVNDIFSKFESIVRERIVGKETEAKSLFAKYDLYQPSDKPTVRLVPVYKTIDKNETLSVDVILRNSPGHSISELGINSIQFNIKDSGYLTLTDIKLNNNSLIDSESPNFNMNDEYIEIIDIVNNSYARSYLKESIWNSQSNEEVIATLEFVGSEIGMANLDFSDGGLILLDSNGNEITNYLKVGSFIDVRGTTDIIPPQIVKVFVNGKLVEDEEVIRLKTEEFNLYGLVTPKKATIKVNNEVVSVNEIGEFESTVTVNDGDIVNIVAINNGQTDTFKFTVDVDKEGPEIIVNGVEQNGLYNTDKTITFTTNDGQITEATLDGETIESGYTTSVNEGEEKEFELVVKAKDDLGNESTETIKFTIDKIAPEITIVGVKDGETYKRARILVGSEDTIESVKLNDEDYKQGSLINTSGEYTLVVNAIDTAGNTTEESISFTIDATEPTIKEDTISIEPEYVKGGDTVNISFETNEEVEGVIVVGSLKNGIVETEYKLENNKHIVSASFDIRNDINAKNVPIKVVLKDTTGNVSEPIKLGTITIDNKAPRVFIKEVTATKGLNGYYVGNNLEFQIVTDGNKIEWKIDDNEIVVVEDQTTNILIDSSLSNGQEHTITYKAYDKANNVTEKTFTFKWDNTVPDAPEISNTEEITNENKFNLNVTFEGKLEVYKVINGEEILRKLTDNSSVEIKLAENENKFVLYAINEAGNRSEGTSYTIKKDTRKPLVKVENINDEINITFSEEVDENSIKAYYKYVDTTSSENSVNWQEVNVTEENGVFKISKNEVDLSKAGKHKVKVTVNDLAGNLGKGHYVTVTIPESLDQDIPLTDDLTLDQNTSGLSGELEVETPDVEAEEGKEFASEPIDLTGNFNEGKVVLRLNLGKELPSETKLYYYNEKTKTWSPLNGGSDGDSLYNPGNDSITETINGVEVTINPGELVAVLNHFSIYGVMVDNTAPEIEIISPVENAVIKNSSLVDGKILVQGTLSEIANVTVSGVQATVNEDNTFEAKIDVTQGDLTIIVSAIDASNNPSTETVNVFVDTVLPVIQTDIPDRTNHNPESLEVSITEINNVNVEVSKDSTVIYSSNEKNINIPVDLSEGDNKFIITVTDQYGNISTVEKNIELDTVGPEFEITDVRDGQTYGQDVTINVLFTEDNCTFKADLYKDDVKTSESPYTSEFTVSLDTEEVHNYTLKVTAFDDLGNTSYKELSFTLDARVPVINVNVNDGETRKDSIALTVTSSGDKLSYTLYKKVNDIDIEVSFASGDTLGEGQYELVVIAENTDSGLSAEKVVDFTIDQTAPDVTINNKTENNIYIGSFTPEIIVSDNFDENVDVWIELNGKVYTPGTSITEKKTHTLTVIAKDDAGNETEVTYTFTVRAASTGGGGLPSTGGGTTEPTDTETKKFTTSGGKESYLEGTVTIEVKENTFDSEVEIAVEIVEETEVTLPTNTENTKYKLLGDVYELNANNVTFNKPVTVTLKYDPNEVEDINKIGVYYYNEETETWEYVGGKVDTESNTITVTLEHFSKYAVMLLDKTFDDIANHWSKEIVEIMASKHIIAGKSEKIFDPDGQITRAEFITLLVEMLGIEPIEGKSSFEDVSVDKWYAKYVEAGLNAGLVYGVSETEYAPNANITREQMTTMIMRANKIVTGFDYTKLGKPTERLFTDEDEISEYAYKAVIAAKVLGIVTGMTETTFEPKGTATRAQGAVIIYNLMNHLDK